MKVKERFNLLVLFSVAFSALAAVAAQAGRSFDTLLLAAVLMFVGAMIVGPGTRR